MAKIDRVLGPVTPRKGDTTAVSLAVTRQSATLPIVGPNSNVYLLKSQIIS